jgi:hypothetical protein
MGRSVSAVNDMINVEPHRQYTSVLALWHEVTGDTDAKERVVVQLGDVFLA